MYRAEPALWSRDNDPRGFEWIIGDDSTNNVLAFIRRSSDGEQLVVIVNFSGVPHEHYRVGLPVDGEWTELVNTDATEYGGSGVGNLGSVTASAGPSHGQPASAFVTVPPLGALFLKPRA